MAEDVYNATIAAREDKGPRTAIFRVKPDRGKVPEFSPGQFVTIGLKEDEAASSPEQLIRRPYTIASPSTERACLELFISRTGDGGLTDRIWKLNDGARLWVDDRIRGTFTLDDIPEGVDMLMVSTGTGIAPFVSMLKTFRGSGRWRRCIIINVARDEADLGYHDELKEIAAADSTLTYLPMVLENPESNQWAPLRERVVEALSRRVDDPDKKAIGPSECHAFLCGNPEMIDAVCEMLINRGFRMESDYARGNLHFERYWT